MLNNMANSIAIVNFFMMEMFVIYKLFNLFSLR